MTMTRKTRYMPPPLVRTLQYFFLNFKSFFCLWKHEKNRPQKLLIISPALFFQYCHPAQNQPKYQFLFHKNWSHATYVWWLCLEHWVNFFRLHLLAIKKQENRAMLHVMTRQTLIEIGSFFSNKLYIPSTVKNTIIHTLVHETIFV